MFFSQIFYVLGWILIKNRFKLFYLLYSMNVTLKWEMSYHLTSFLLLFKMPFMFRFFLFLLSIFLLSYVKVDDYNITLNTFVKLNKEWNSHKPLQYLLWVCFQFKKSITVLIKLQAPCYGQRWHISGSGSPLLLWFDINIFILWTGPSLDIL